MIRYATITFAVSALMGPMIRLITYALHGLEASSGFGMVVYDLVIYLWPALPFTANHRSDRIFTLGIIYPSVANVILFTLLGLIVGTARRRGIALSLTYIVLCASSFLYWWWVHKEIGYVVTFGFFLAMLFYAIPFWLVARAGRRIELSSANITMGHA